MSKRRRNVTNLPSSSVHYTDHQPHLISNQGIIDSQAAGNAAIMEHGHVVHPNLIRLAAITKTMRSYIPSFTSLNTSIGFKTPAHEGNTTNASGSDQRTGPTFGSYTTTQSKAITSSASVDKKNEDVGSGIQWSRWLTIHERPYLAIAYAKGGLHIWDVSSLDAVKEVLFVPSIGIVRSVTAIPPEPSLLSGDDAYRLAIIVGEGADSLLTIHSLVNHTCLKRISIPGAVSVSSNARFTVVAVGSSQDTVNQSSGLLVLSSTSFKLLQFIRSSELAPHTLSSPIYSLSFSRLLAYASAPPPSHRPVKLNSPAASGYPPTTISTASTTGYLTGMNLTDVVSGAMRLGTGVMDGVRKVGEIGLDAAGYSTGNGGKRGIFSQSAPASPSPLTSRLYASSGKTKGVPQKAFNDEHDDAAVEWVTVVDLQVLLDQHESTSNEDEFDAVVSSPTSSFHSSNPPLMRLDLSKLTNQQVQIITEFMYTRNSSFDRPSRPSKRSSPAASSTHLAPNSGANTPSKAISVIAWSPNGALLAISGIDGATVRVFKVSRHTSSKRSPSIPYGSVGTSRNVNHDTWMSEANGVAEIAYELVRGVTAAAIRDISWSADGLWSAAISSHGTLHAFTVDPTGGLPNLQSYIDDRVINTRNFRPSGARIQAVARLRQPVVPTTDSPPGTLTKHDANEVQRHLRRQSDSADLGVDQADSSPNEVQIPSCYFVPGVNSRSSQFLPPPPNTSPPTPMDPTVPILAPSTAGAFKDVLVFDLETSLMGLWRCTLRPSNKGQPALAQSERSGLERTTSVSGVVPKEDAVSGGGGILGFPSSLSSKRVISGITRIAGISRAGEGIANALSGIAEGTWEGSVIASWDLKKRDDWTETKSVFAGSGEHTGGKENPKLNYLAFAELTTFPIRSLVLPRPIYLSHQFVFSALATDYHALVRRLDLNPTSFPVTMRKETVIMRGMDDGPGFEHTPGTSAPSEFDSDANFLGNTGLLDLTDSPMLGGHLELAPESLPIPSSFASTSATSLSSHSQSRAGRKILRRSIDENLSSAIESHLRLDASHSPSSSGIASPGKVIPMLPNGRPGSSGNGIGLDSIVRGTTRVGKEVWGGISNVRSPRIVPTKRSSAGGSASDLLEFDEEDEMFIADDLDGDKLAVADIELEKAEDPAIIGGREVAPLGESSLTRDGSVRTIGPGVWTAQGGFDYPLLTDSGMTVMPSSTLPDLALHSKNTPVDAKPADEGTWVAQPDLYTQAVEEDARFDDVTGILDEERAEREALQGSSVSKPVRKNSGLAKGGRRTSSRDVGRKLAEFDADLSSDARSTSTSGKSGKRARAKKKR